LGASNRDSIPYVLMPIRGNIYGHGSHGGDIECDRTVFQKALFLINPDPAEPLSRPKNQNFDAIFLMP